MNAKSSVFRIALLLGILSMACGAQMVPPTHLTPSNDTGVQPYGSYAGLHESVNLTNGNVHIEVPLVSLKGRNGQNLSLTAQYDSKNFNLSGSYDPMCDAYTYTWSVERHDPSMGVGWRLSIPYLEGGRPNTDSEGTPDGTYANYIFTDWSGAKHELVSPWGKTASDSDQDPASIRLTVNSSLAVVTTSDGIKYFFNLSSTPPYIDSIASQIVDADGNKINIGSDWTVTDNLNHQIKIGSTIKYVDANGETQTIQINSVSLPYGVTFANPQPRGRLCSGLYTVVVRTNYPRTGSISSIVLPNGDTYSFEYNAYGEVLRTTYPTGGYTTYNYVVKTYAMDLGDYGNPLADFREISQKQDCASSAGPCYTTNYDYSSGQNNNGVADVTENFGGTNPTHTRYYFTQSGSGGQLVNSPALETRRDTFVGSSTNLLRSVTTVYTTTSPQLPATVTTTLDDGSQFHETFQYDSYQALICGLYSCNPQTRLLPNVTHHNVYDFNGNLIKQTNTTWSNVYYTGANEFLRIMHLKTQEEVGNGAQTISSTDWTYDNYTLGNPLISNPLPGGQTAFPASYTTRGKVTSITRHSLRNCGTDSTEIFQYDNTGNLRVYTDPRGHRTTLGYAATTTQNCVPDGAPGPTVATDGSYITSITLDNSLSSHYLYFACTGALASATDANSQTTSYGYDKLGRLISTVINSDGATVTNEYHEQASPPYLLTNSIGKVSKVVLDGLGRSVHTIVCEDGASCNQTITTDADYDFRNRKISETNPHRSTSAATDGTTFYTYDELNRTKVITKPDNSVFQTAYVGAVTTVTDEAGRTRESTADVLGRMIKVREDVPTGPTLTYVTNYNYDVLGNLTAVTQNGDGSGARTRSFVYNGKSELCSATNPETGNTGSGAIQYQYDADGLVTLKTFNSGNTIAFTYDTIHRVTNKHYTAVDPNRSTPDVTYTYDSTAGGNLGLGYRTGMSDGSGSTSWTYDPRARITEELRSINTGLATLTRAVDYHYRQDSNIDWIKYPHVPGDPSPQTVSYEYDSLGRPTTAQLPQLDPSKNINVSGTQYGPTGALARVTFGTNINGAFSFNNRLQPRHLVYMVGNLPANYDSGALDQQTCPSSVGNIIHMLYNFGTTTNNGNLQTATNCKDTSRNETFTYDYLNRVTSASTPTGSGNYWAQSFSYDPWANLKTVAGTNAPGLAITTVTTANQFTATDQYAYDADGNMTRNGSVYYVYDVENRVKYIVGGASYTYDGDGNRVVKSSGTVYWGGLAETDRTASGTILAEYVSFGGTRVARIDSPLSPSSSVHYYFADLIQSVNVVTSSAGAIQNESMFYPFGGERPIQSGDSNHYKFTGKERDETAGETGLDFFGARYYASTVGRWMSPDWSASVAPVPYADLTNPQSLNLYQYVGNNPVTGIDPDGHMSRELDGFGRNTQPPCGGIGMEMSSNWLEIDTDDWYLTTTDGSKTISQTFLGTSTTVTTSAGSTTTFAAAQQQSQWSTTPPTSGHYLTNSYYPKAAGGRGHWGVGLDTPDKTEGMATNDGVPKFLRAILLAIGVPLPGAVHDDSMVNQSGVHRFYKPLTDAQFDAARSAMQSRKSSSGLYSLYFRNCALWVESVDHAAGVSEVPHIVVFPKVLRLWYP